MQSAGDQFQATTDAIEAIATRRIRCVWSLPGGALSTEFSASPRGLLSGAFNPLHAGHIELRTAAENWIGGAVFFELPIVNADKPPLDCATVETRRRQFAEHPVALTAAPTFVEKANIFPATAFIVGFDTAVRILDPKFYGQSETAMRDALRQIRESECSFLVAGRISSQGFQTLSELPVPAAFRDLFDELPEVTFRRDISSTRLRNEGSA